MSYWLKQTLTIPDTLNGWDTLPPPRVTAAAAANAVDMESDLAASRELLMERLNKAVNAGDASARVPFVKPWREGRKVPTLAEILFDSIQQDAVLQTSVIQILLAAQEGQNVQLMAQLFLSTVVERVAQEEAVAL